MSDTPLTDAVLVSTRYCNVEDEWKTAKKLLAHARKQERALTMLFDWYERDGSVGGASVAFKEAQSMLAAAPTSPTGGTEGGR